MVDGHHGQSGHNVVQHVEQDLHHASGHVTILCHGLMGSTVRVKGMKKKRVTHYRVPVSLNFPINIPAQ